MADLEADKIGRPDFGKPSRGFYGLIFAIRIFKHANAYTSKFLPAPSKSWILIFFLFGISAFSFCLKLASFFSCKIIYEAHKKAKLVVLSRIHQLTDVSEWEYISSVFIRHPHTKDDMQSSCLTSSKMICLCHLMLRSYLHDSWFVLERHHLKLVLSWTAILEIPHFNCSAFL